MKAEETKGKGRKLIIVGASGHGKVVADIALLNGYTEIIFVDADKSKKECAGFPVFYDESILKEMIGDKIVAIGNPTIRERIQEGVETVSLIHPNAVIGSNVRIGQGTVIMAGAVINSDAVIGNGCIINTSSSVDHDCIIEDYVHISVGSHVCGGVHIGRKTWIGAGATVINNVSICANSVVGIGAAVVKNIEKEGTYIGVPARLMC